MDTDLPEDLTHPHDPGRMPFIVNVLAGIALIVLLIGMIIYAVLSGALS